MADKPTINVTLGHTWTYPDHNWEWVANIPERVALEWMRLTVPDAQIAGYRDVDVQEVIDNRYQWLNKLAVIVENEDMVIALYKHDFACWIIRLRENEE